MSERDDASATALQMANQAAARLAKNQSCDSANNVGEGEKSALLSDHHSNHIFHDDGANSSIYAFEYHTWIGLPQSNESNACDSPSGAGALCVWFLAGQITTTDCAWHFGPIRSSNTYHSNFGFYCSGVGTEVTNSSTVPMAQWVKYRVWRLSISGPRSEWGIWRDNEFMGSVTLNGGSATSTMNWTEIIETNPCATDFERVYFNSPRFWHQTIGANLQPISGSVNYETNCSNSSWSKADANPASDFVENVRQVARDLAQGSFAWHK
ncbi:MAG: hypothetical protein R2754_16985 [Microthrixaceae bacterium]